MRVAINVEVYCRKAADGNREGFLLAVGDVVGDWLFGRVVGNGIWNLVEIAYLIEQKIGDLLSGKGNTPTSGFSIRHLPDARQEAKTFVSLWVE